MARSTFGQKFVQGEVVNITDTLDLVDGSTYAGQVEGGPVCIQTRIDGADADKADYKMTFKPSEHIGIGYPGDTIQAIFQKAGCNVFAWSDWDGAVLNMEELK